MILEGVPAPFHQQKTQLAAGILPVVAALLRSDHKRDDIRRYRRALIFIDPVMADNGKLYAAFDESYAKLNAGLCGSADIIVPNITEACFMTDTEYKEEYDEDYVKELLGKLAKLGSKVAVLTGVSLSEGKTGVYGLDTRTNEYFTYQNDKVMSSYHGTGDVFSSVTVGAILRGLGMKDAFKLAADYTAKTIKVTEENPDNPWYGVDFEATIPELVNDLAKAVK